MRKPFLAAVFAAALAVVAAPAASAQIVSNVTQIGMGTVYALVTDSAGNVYFPDYNANTLVEIPSNGDGTYGAQVVLQSNFGNPHSIAMLPNGDLLVGDHDKVWKVPGPDYDTKTAFYDPGSNDWYELAVDSAGNVFAATYSDNYVVKLDASNNYAPTTIYSPSIFAFLVGGIAVDANDNVFIPAFVDNNGTVRVVELLAANNYDNANANIIDAGLGNASGIGIDSNSHLYVGDSNGDNTIKFLPAPDYASYQLFGGVSAPRAVWVDRNTDNIFFAGVNNKIWMIGALPMVTGVSPSVGPLTGGNFVSLVGKHFENPADTNIIINGQSPNSAPQSDSAQVQMPAGTGTVRLKVSSFSHPEIVSPDVPQDVYTYLPVPTVTGISPGAGDGNGGTSVTITGTSLTFTDRVQFGGTDAQSFTVDSDTQVTAVSPSGLDTVDVVVTTAGGVSPTGAADKFTYGPVVVGVGPKNDGPETGGSTVTVTGYNFLGATAVQFGSNAATNVTVVNDNAITATTPAGTGDVSISVTANGVTSTGSLYHYIPAAGVSQVSPSSGPATGGTSVTISGSSLNTISGVTFGGVAATGVSGSFFSASATTPPHAAGIVDVVVTTDGGSTTALGAFAYSASVPTVSSVAPNKGPTGGGTSVTITGTGLSFATSVKFGTTNAPGYTVVNDSHITVASPAASAAGTVDVTVTTAPGTSPVNSNDQFTYVAAPAVTALSPVAGPLAGGTAVTLTGTNFTDATAVTFGGTPATSLTVNSATKITVHSPGHAAGAVDVEVTTPGGTSTAVTADKFTYEGAPTVTAINPNQGTAAGGTLVSIVGTNLTGATGVKFGTTAAASFSPSSATSATATAPAHAVGAVNVTLTTPGGTSAVAAAGKGTFTYTATPKATEIATFAGGKKDGGRPIGWLIADSTGVLYGTTSEGGQAGLGTVFSLTPGSSATSFTKKILHGFDGTDGAVPYDGMVMDKAGALYLTTSLGGAHNKGAVVKLTPPSYAATVLYSFAGSNTDGGEPWSGLVRDAKGVLYGTTTSGGAKNFGTAFKLTPGKTASAAYTFALLHSFTGAADANDTIGTLAMDKSGNLYGSGFTGGAHNVGSVFKMTTAGTITLLHSFVASTADGKNPDAGLLIDKNNNLYGTTFNGGASNKGAVFKLTPPSTADTPLLFSFTGTTGGNPYASLVADSAGVLYGTTVNGGANNKGVVFKLIPPANGQSAWGESVMYSFKAGKSDGAFPYANVLLGKSGILYGTASGGGSAACTGGCGSVFMVQY